MKNKERYRILMIGMVLDKALHCSLKGLSENGTYSKWCESNIGHNGLFTSSENQRNYIIKID